MSILIDLLTNIIFLYHKRKETKKSEVTPKFWGFFVAKYPKQDKELKSNSIGIVMELVQLNSIGLNRLANLILITC